MTLCEAHRNCYVIYDTYECPLCEAEEQIREAEKQIEEFEDEVANQKDEVMGLERELREKGDSV